MTWNKERTEFLWDLVVDGKQPCEIIKIAPFSEMTKNMIIGKINRLKAKRGVVVPKPKSKPSTPRVRKARERAARPAPALAPILPAREPEPVHPNARVGVQGLRARQCRWPIGDPRDADFHFCTSEQVPGGPYCAHHMQVAYVPPRPRRVPQETRLYKAKVNV